MPVATFQKPPVGEVSFGLGFAPLPALKLAHYGLFWDQIRKDYPESGDKAPFFDAANLPALGPFGPDWWFPLPRVWFLHRNRNYLIQLQPNRLWLNWRRLNDAEQYPRFEALLPSFQQEFKRFSDFVTANNIGSVTVTGAELSYVNHILVEGMPRRYSDVGEFMSDVRWGNRHQSLPEPTGMAWRTEFDIDSTKLSIDLKSGKELSGALRPLFILEIRASTNVAADFGSDPAGWFKHANNVIVQAFCDVTTEKAQSEFWQRVS